MGRNRGSKNGTYITPSGKKIITLHILPEFEKEINERAASKNLTRQAYLITLINADLEQAKMPEAST